MNVRQLLTLTGVAGAAALISCGDDQTFGLPNEGAILVAALTSGEDLDQNGYTFSVDGGNPSQIGLQDTVYVAALEPGEYEVLLGGVAGNCAPAVGTNPRTVTVVAADTVSVVFDVACEVIGPPGGGGP